MSFVYLFQYILIDVVLLLLLLPLLLPPVPNHILLSSFHFEPPSSNLRRPCPCLLCLPPHRRCSPLFPPSIQPSLPSTCYCPRRPNDRSSPTRYYHRSLPTFSPPPRHANGFPFSAVATCAPSPTPTILSSSSHHRRPHHNTISLALIVIVFVFPSLPLLLLSLPLLSLSLQWLPVCPLMSFAGVLIPRPRKPWTLPAHLTRTWPRNFTAAGHHFTVWAPFLPLPAAASLLFVLLTIPVGGKKGGIQVG